MISPISNQLFCILYLLSIYSHIYLYLLVCCILCIYFYLLLIYSHTQTKEHAVSYASSLFSHSVFTFHLLFLILYLPAHNTEDMRHSLFLQKEKKIFLIFFNYSSSTYSPSSQHWFLLHLLTHTDQRCSRYVAFCTYFLGTLYLLIFYNFYVLILDDLCIYSVFTYAHTDQGSSKYASFYVCSFCTHSCIHSYGVATMSRLFTIMDLFCKRALYKRLYSAKNTWNLIDPTNCSRPIFLFTLTNRPRTRWMCGIH